MSNDSRETIAPALEEFRCDIGDIGDIIPLSLGVAVYGFAFGLLAAGQGMGALAR